MKVLITESQYNKIIDKFLSDIFEPHEVMPGQVYPNSVFWIKDGETIAEIERSKTFWVRSDIWKLISSMFSFQKEETKQVMKEWLKNHYGLGSLTPNTFFQK